MGVIIAVLAAPGKRGQSCHPPPFVPFVPLILLGMIGTIEWREWGWRTYRSLFWSPGSRALAPYSAVLYGVGKLLGSTLGQLARPPFEVT